MEWTITEYQEWINNGMPINTSVTKLNLFSNNLTTLPESIGKSTALIVNLTQLGNYSKKKLTIIENEIKELFNIHKNYFHNYIFEELIMKTIHPSRMSQFIEYDSDSDSN